MLNFDFSEKRLGIVAHYILCMIFQEKYFANYSVNWPNFIVWFPLILEILGNMYIVIVCFPTCGVINFEINLIFLIAFPYLSKAVFYMTKKSRQNVNIPKAKRDFQVKWKSFFIILKRCQFPKIVSDLRVWAFNHLFPECLHALMKYLQLQKQPLEVFYKKRCSVTKGLRTATLLKKRLWHRYFSVNFEKFLRTFFFTEHL